MVSIFEIGFITTWLAASMRLTGPLLLASLGELYSERSGVLNVGIEGTILLGALGAYLGAIWMNSSWVGVLIAIITGLIFNIFLAWM